MSYSIGTPQVQGTNDSGDATNLATTAEGHLEVAIHAPRLPFGSLHAEKLTPIFQSDAVYGLNSELTSSGVTGSGWAYTSDSNFVVQTGTQLYSQGNIQSVKRLRYRAGQGIVGRFAGFFTSGVTGQYNLAGFGHAEDGVFFGYKDTDFGIVYSSRGKREVQTLTVSTGATSNGNVTITLNGVAYTVPVTNASNVYRTAWEIATYSGYIGWKAEPNGATVVFVADSVGNRTLTFSFGAGATGAAAAFSETQAGQAATEVFIKQSDWNGDKLDGTGASGVLLNPTKGNVYQIGIQYLGYGALSFYVEVVPVNGNNPDFVLVHTIENPNSRVLSTFGNPSFPFTMAAYSAGSTTNVSVNVASFAGFIEGNKTLHGGRFTYYNQLTTVGSTNFQALFTILNTRYYKGRTNQAVINMLNVSGALKHTSPCIFYLIKNGTLAGNPNFQQLASNSVSYWDTAATTVTYSTGDQLLATFHLGDTNNFDHHFGNGEFNSEEVTLQPGEWITLAAKAVTGTPSYVTGSINTREDQ